MSFRLLNVGNGVGIIPPEKRTVVEDFIHSNTGKAFKGTTTEGSSSTYYLFQLPGYIAADIWIKFDLYIDSASETVSNFRLGYWQYSSAYESKNFDYWWGLRIVQNKIRFEMDNADSSYASTTSPIDLKMQAINEVWCHQHNEAGADKSYAEVKVNGVTASKTTKRDSRDYAIGSEVEALKTMVIAFPSSAPCYVSNLIISDEELSPKEQVMALPISATSTNMTKEENVLNDGGSLFIADAEGQTLLQTPDVAELIATYGANSTVTSAMVVGNPAYRTGQSIASLIGISLKGTTLTEHGDCKLSSKEVTAVVTDSWGMTDTTIADLQSMQFGWKVGK